jgi:hypothetical protein
MKKRLWILFVVVLAALLLWAPWLNSASAKERAEQYFLSAWQGVADGCGLSCKGCGGVAIQRVIGGWMVTIEYACGLIPEDTPQYHEQEKGFVSVLGTVHGFQRP